MEPLAGDDPVEIAGYQLRARLGSGGMGRVYLAFTPAGRPVALKVVRPDLGGDAEFRRRFRQEVDAARRVHGMYTAQVLDAGPDASPPWLVTAYVPGPSLQEAVALHGPMPEQTVFVLLAGVAEALAAIHAAGVVHRDLKPSNVLLAPDGPRVIDFGIARAADSTVLTGTGMLIGSPPFMAPEQVKGEAITQAVDVFAFGAVAVFAATGQSAFGDGDSMGILYRVMHSEPDLGGCPPRLREVVGRCLTKDPAARPSPAEIIAACRAQAAAQAGGIAPPWLPPDMLAALAQHAPSNAPLSPWAPMTHASTTPVVPLAADGALPTQGGAPTQGSVAPVQGGAAPPLGDPGASGRFPVHRTARTRPMLLGGVFGVIGAAALAVTGVLTLGGHNGNSAAPGTPNATHSLAAAQRPASTASSASTRRPSATAATRSASAKITKRPSVPAASPSATRKRSYAVDSCLVGDWKDAGDVLDNTIDGQSGQFTGTGGGMEVNAGGGVTQQLGPETLTATITGNVWTEVLRGSATMHATTRGGDIIFSDVNASPDASYKPYENGVYNNSGPMSVSTNPTRYTCSSSTLRLYWSDGTSTYDRES
ncbi:MAG TPA: protein kinase [Streptosporangiaceae bacterium]